MTKQDYLMLAKAISKAKKKKVPAHLMADQIAMEIVASILDQDKTFDYREFFKQCNS
jgi:hypothetical protein